MPRTRGTVEADRDTNLRSHGLSSEAVIAAELSIGLRRIGGGHPVFIIAEAGVNHNGDLELAKRLIREAKQCGADGVKFQTFKAERVATQAAPKAQYQLQTTDPRESQIAMLRKLELTQKSHKELMSLCEKEGITFLSTPYNTEDADMLDALGVPAFKVASGQMVEPVFLRHVARKGKPVILSTGMATLDEVGEAVRAIREAGSDQLVLLQCTTNYPSRLEDANLLAIQTMRDAFAVPIGYSDHTQSATACVAAVALGACVIEKHFTLDKSLPGPDQSSSADPEEFRQLVVAIREAELVLGSGLKQPAEVEKRNMLGMRRSIVSAVSITAGTVITEDMLAFKRPGTGVSPGRLGEVVGRVAAKDIPEDAVLDLAWLE